MTSLRAALLLNTSRGEREAAGLSFPASRYPRATSFSSAAGRHQTLSPRQARRERSVMIRKEKRSERTAMRRNANIEGASLPTLEDFAPDGPDDEDEREAAANVDQEEALAPPPQVVLPIPDASQRSRAEAVLKRAGITKLNEDLVHPNIEIRTRAILSVRKVLVSERGSAEVAGHLVTVGILPHIYDAISQSQHSRYLFESLWALGAIAYFLNSAIDEARVLESCVAALHREAERVSAVRARTGRLTSTAIQEQVCWLLGNLANGSASFRARCVVTPVLVSQLGDLFALYISLRAEEKGAELQQTRVERGEVPIKDGVDVGMRGVENEVVEEDPLRAPGMSKVTPSALNLFRHASWALSGVVKSPGGGAQLVGEPLAHAICELLTQQDDSRTIANLVWILADLAEARAHEVLEWGILDRLLRLALHPDVTVQAGVVTCLARLAWGDEQASRMLVLKRVVAPLLAALRQECSAEIWSAATWTLATLCERHNPWFVGSLVEDSEELVVAVVVKLGDSRTPPGVRQDCCLVMRSLVRFGEIRGRNVRVESLLTSVVPAISRGMECSTREFGAMASMLRCLAEILELGCKWGSPFHEHWEREGGLERLRWIEDYAPESSEVYRLAVAVTEMYFSGGGEGMGEMEDDEPGWKENERHLDENGGASMITPAAAHDMMGSRPRHYPHLGRSDLFSMSNSTEMGSAATSITDLRRDRVVFDRSGA